MRRLNRLFRLAMMFLFSNDIHTQCISNLLPNKNGVDTVGNVSELANALIFANTKNGDYTILLKNGVYILNTDLPFIARDTRNLTIRGLSGNRDSVILKGQGMNGGVGFIFNVSASNFTAADITIGWISKHGIQIHGESNADSCIIQNIRFADINEQMLKISSAYDTNYSDNGIVSCCLFEFTSPMGNQFYTGGIDGHGCRNWTVKNNTFKNIKSPDNQLAEHAIHFWSLSSGTLVEKNLIINCDRGIGFGLSDENKRRHSGGIIRNNIVCTTRDCGITLEASSNTQVYNNTLYTLYYPNSIEYRFDSTYNVHIANNLVNKAISRRDRGKGVLQNNFLYTDTSLFVNVSIHDFHLKKSNERIVDKGTKLTDVVSDYDCRIRPLGKSVDIGAYEYGTSDSVCQHIFSPQK